MDFEMEEQVRHRAYEIWECEGRPDGRAFEHWDQATRELSLAAYAPVATKIEGAAKTVIATPAKGRIARSKAPVKTQLHSAKSGQVTLN